jgi:hypothetical protein
VARSASIGSVRVANHAGAAPNSTPVINARPTAKASTNGEGVTSIGSIVAPANARESNNRAAPIATPSPTTAPPTASRTLSISASRTICERDAPRARRTAIWPRRVTARASSRLATFAHAMSSTITHTTRRIRRLRPYCSFITPTPAPAGTTGDDLVRHHRSMFGIQFAGYPASCRIHCGGIQ